MSDCILFFVKYPEPGEVKTRLAKDCSPELAADFYRVFAKEKLAELLVTPDADIIVCFAPETAKPDMADWLGKGPRFIAQKGADLSRRMENGFREAFFMRYQRVVLVGSDIAGLTPAILRTALDMLTPETACIGPADDGGYYLIGFHRQGFQPEIFHDMPLNHSYVLQGTVDKFASLGMECVEVETLEDIDTLEDLETLVALGSMGPLKGEALEMAKKITGL